MIPALAVLIILALMAAVVIGALRHNPDRPGMAERWRERRVSKTLQAERDAALRLISTLREQAWLYRDIEPVSTTAILGKIAEFNDKQRTLP